MKGHLILNLLFQVAYDTLAWEVTMPKEIHGLKGSCLVIPCSFQYTSYPPSKPDRVVWYQWVSKGYPLVYDPWNSNDVIDKFRGKTDLYGNPSRRDCSLLIKSIDQSHNGVKLYTWIDPENVGSSTYAFYDVTSTILVDTSPESPTINIYGGEKTGNVMTVACITHHTCPYSKPNIILKGIEGSDSINHEQFKDGLWKTTLTRTGVVKDETSNIACSVTYHGGIKATSTRSKTAKCVHYNTTIEPELADVIEGVAKQFVCNVYHTCQKENPTITWNYKNMQVSHENKKLSGLNLAFSSITFLGTNKDNLKKLTCTAKFSGGDFTASVILRVQSYIPPVTPNQNEKYIKPVTPNQNETLFNYEADMVPTGFPGIKLYAIAASLVILLSCILAVFIICKRRRRSNTMPPVSGNTFFSKPRMPSPKSEPKSFPEHDEVYVNTEDLNIYGNV